KHPGINGHPAGIGWGAGRAVVVNCECELTRVAPGDVLVTRVAGPALSQVLPRVAGVVAELGGSTSHLASLARERGIPMVLDVIDREVIAANPQLRMIASQSITPDNIDVAAASKCKIPVTVVPPIVSEAAADITFGLMLMVARRMIEGNRLVHRGRFPGSQSS